MNAAARIALPVFVPRAVLFWTLARLGFALLPLAVGQPFGSIAPPPAAIVLLCGVVGLVDIRVRGERLLWANLGVATAWLFAIFGATAITAECLLALALH